MVSNLKLWQTNKRNGYVRFDGHVLSLSAPRITEARKILACFQHDAISKGQEGYKIPDSQIEQITEQLIKLAMRDGKQYE